jgi:phosphatidylserine decarboxylase
VLRALPRRLVSRLLGQLGRLRPPAPLLQAVLKTYCRHYGVALDEMERPLPAYRSFLEFFTRRLKPGLRPPPPDPLAVASPADGRIVAAGPVEAGALFQAKGVAYRLVDLLGSDEAARRFEGGTFLTLYLGPGDYHRFHWPWSGRIEALRHLPGDLWPVNAGGVASIPGLFARNERVALLGTTEAGGSFAFVAVGALNVGSIRLAALPGLRTNRTVFHPRTQTGLSLRGARGAELGWFEFGSALVLLLEREAGHLEPLAPGTPVRVGQPLGALHRPA